MIFGGCGRTDHITVLEFEEKPVILCKEYIFHQFVVFDHFKEVHDVQILRQHLLSLLQLDVFLSLLQMLERTSGTAHQPAEAQ